MYKEIDIPVWHKAYLTAEEAAAYTNIGINKVRELMTLDDADFVLRIGKRSLIRRDKFEQYLSAREVI